MPRRQQLVLECEFCTNTEIFDLSPPRTNDEREKFVSKMEKWNGVSSALSPAGPNAPDTTRWYDSIACMTSGEKRMEEALRLERQVAGAANGDSRLSPAAQASGATAVHEELPLNPVSA